jgi:hypothetical protein
MSSKIFPIIALVVLFIANTNAQTFSEIQKIVASDRAGNDEYGISLAASGNYVIVGARLEDEDTTGSNTLNDAGSAYIYKNDGTGNWNQYQKIVSSDRGTDDRFGHSVAISGDYAIAGAYREDEDTTGGNFISQAGSAYIFEKDISGTWIETQKMVAQDRANDDRFGWNVSIDGNFAVVSAYLEDEDVLGLNTLDSAGSVYIFERDINGTWNVVQKIVASDRGAKDIFGWSIAVNGNYLVVGAEYEDEDVSGGNTMSNSGSAYIFERDGAGVWNEVQKIVASDRDIDDLFGHSVSINGTYAIVGARGENTFGAAYVFERDGSGTWNEVQKITASDQVSLDLYGQSVSINGSMAAVGSIYHDYDATGQNFLTNAGAVYLYERDGGGTWNETQKIVNSDRETTDLFGYSIAIGSNNIFATAVWEDEDVIGGNSLSKSGSAYIYKTCFESSSIISVMACGNSYTVPSGDETYSTPGTYNDTIQNAGGCDSLLTINLTLNNNSSGSESITTCDSYTWPVNGNTYISSGTYNTTLINALGCDSLVTLNLIINNSNSGSEAVTTCDNYTWNSATYTISGTYNTTLTNIAGCDSLATLNLTIINSTTGSETITTCDNYTWPANGNTYTSSGAYNVTLTNTVGCDSLVTLNLTINNSNTGSETVTACDNYTWNSNTYNSSGTYNATLINVFGCDSMVTLNLTIDTVDASLTQSGILLTANAIGAIYQWVSCPSITPISGETNQSFTAIVDGYYAVIVTQNGCTDTSACATVTGVGIVEKGFEDQLLVYPNPTQGVFAIDLGNTFPEITISINDIVGKMVYKENFYEQKLLSLSLEQPAGVYFMRIEVGTKQAVIRLVKQ